MKPNASYLNVFSERSIVALVQAIDRDVERGEDLLMLGLAIVMLSPTLAPIAPPTVLLPAVALIFALTVIRAHRHYRSMESKLFAAVKFLEGHERLLLQPIVDVFVRVPSSSLASSFDPSKNWKRTAKSALGGVLINPLWMPIFYMMGLQIHCERLLFSLNQAVIGVENNLRSRSWVSCHSEYET